MVKPGNILGEVLRLYVIDATDGLERDRWCYWKGVGSSGRYREWDSRLANYYYLGQGDN